MGGYTGYKSLGHSAFYGLGAYLVAVTAANLGWNPLISAPILAIIVFIVAMLLGWVMVRTSGAAFVIATIAMLLIFRILALNLRNITNGAPGLSQPLPPLVARILTNALLLLHVGLDDHCYRGISLHTPIPIWFGSIGHT